MFLLKFIFLAFIIFIIIGVFAALSLLRYIRGIIKTFRGGKGFSDNRNSQNYYYGNRSSNYTDRSGNDTIIDHRSPNEINKKIFSKNEGEYVDFEEEK